MSLVMLVTLLWCSTLSESGVVDRRWFVPWRSVTVVSTRFLTETRAASCVHMHPDITPCDSSTIQINIKPTATFQQELQSTSFHIEPSVPITNLPEQSHPTIFMGKQRYNWAFLNLETTLKHVVTVTKRVIDPSHVVTLQCYSSDMPLCDEDIMLQPNNDNISLTKLHEHKNVIADEVTMATKTMINMIHEEPEMDPKISISQQLSTGSEISTGYTVTDEEETTINMDSIVNEVVTDSTIYQETTINTDEINSELTEKVFHENQQYTTLSNPLSIESKTEEIEAVTMITDVTMVDDDVTNEIVDSDQMETETMSNTLDKIIVELESATMSTMQDDYVTAKVIVVSDNADKQ